MKSTSILCIALLTLVATPAFAEDAGSVLFAKGDVSAEREPAVPLAKGDAVLAGDTVATGAASRAQLLMIDGAKIAIRPESRLRIDEYAIGEEGTDATMTTSGDKGVMSLVKGGFRTITGAIGKDDRADYEVRTPVGVLGIRGTDYTAVFCRGDCDWVPGVAAGSPIEDGLYLGVFDGRIIFSNAQASIELDAGEYAFIPLETNVPKMLDSPPDALRDDIDLVGAGGKSAQGFNASLNERRSPDSSAPQRDDGSANGDKRSESAAPEAPKQPVIGIDADGTPIDITPGGAPPQGARSISYSTGPLGAINATWSSATVAAAGELQLDFGNNVIGFTGPYPDRQVPVVATYEIGTSSLVDTGFDPITVLRWGRWAGGTATITLSDGTVASQSLANQSLHWITGPDGAAPSMPITGIANYTLIGATAPTDTLGNTGVLGSATLQADFLAQRVDSTLLIDINGASWSASGFGSIGAAAGLPAHLFDGFYDMVAIDGVAGGFGEFSGFFSGPDQSSDPDNPAAVGLTYSLQDAQGTTTVSGAAALGNP